MTQESMNARTISQSLDTAIEGTQAQAVLTALPSERKQAMLSALAALDAEQQGIMMNRLMTMTDATASLVDEVIATGKKVGMSYTVQKGDSLSKIAKAHNISLSAIIKANPQIENPDLIHPNQKIHLPHD